MVSSLEVESVLLWFHKPLVGYTECVRYVNEFCCEDKEKSPDKYGSDIDSIQTERDLKLL